MSEPADRACKLCGGKARYKWSLALVGGMEGAYFECGECGLLQSYHLDAMTAKELTRYYQRDLTLNLDAGAAWRQFCVASRLSHLWRSRVIQCSVRPKYLDWGGGSGFSTGYVGYRHGWDAYAFDPFMTPCFSPERFFHRYEDATVKGPYNIVVATEVFEHLLQPREDLERISALLDPTCAFVYITTGRYEPGLRDKTWPYFAPDSGQHVAFWSRGAMEKAASLMGMDVVLRPGTEYEWLLVRSPVARCGPGKLRLKATAAALRAMVGIGVLRKII